MALIGALKGHKYTLFDPLLANHVAMCFSFVVFHLHLVDSSKMTCNLLQDQV